LSVRQKENKYKNNLFLCYTKLLLLKVPVYLPQQNVIQAKVFHYLSTTTKYIQNVKVPRPRDSKGTFSISESRCQLLLPV